MTTVFNPHSRCHPRAERRAGLQRNLRLFRAAMKNDWSPIGDDTFSTFFLDQVQQGNELAKQIQWREPNPGRIPSYSRDHRAFDDSVDNHHDLSRSALGWRLPRLPV